MFGISGTALGAILKSKGYDYKDISIVGLIYGLVVLVLTLILSGIVTLTTWTLSGTLANLSIVGEWVSELALGTLALTIIGAVVIGIAGFISLIIGAVIFDAAEAVIKAV